VQALLSDWLLPAPGLPAATTDDTNWMFLHYHLLLALRDTRPSVRVLEMLQRCGTDRTDTYMPDAVPFLQEILEDDDQAVEAKCKEFIQHMRDHFRTEY
jgi:hypothetical protein